jgi:hypothetical protein
LQLPAIQAAETRQVKNHGQSPPPAIESVVTVEEAFMRTGTDWGPRQYLKFSGERTQPALDLIARI